MAITTKVSASNAAIINKVRANASLEYRRRIPVATQANLQKTMALINDFQPFWNEFINVLINRIGLTLFNTNNFTNKLAPLKSGMLSYGGVVQEMGANLIQAEDYDPNATNVFDAPEPDMEVDYHQINKRLIYPMRLNEDLLMEAAVDDGQLQAYLNNLLVLPTQSNEWDEYCIMRELLGDYQRADGFANFQVPNLATSTNPERDGKAITEIIRELYLATKDFYTDQYNAAGMQVTSGELILLGTPRFFAKLDVNVLASAYHMDKADFFADRTIVVDRFPDNMANTQAMLLDADFYKVFDTNQKTTSIYNPRSLDWVYYLHSWGIYSVSRMRNALRFSPDPTNVNGSVNIPSVTSVAITSDGTTLAPGAEIQLTPEVTYSNGTKDANAYMVITGMSADAASDGTWQVVLPDSGTYVDRLGVLRVSPTSTYKALTITAIATLDGTKSANLVLGDASAASEEPAKDGGVSTPPAKD